MSSPVIARERSRPASKSKHAVRQRALTSHGWPRVCRHTVASVRGERLPGVGGVLREQRAHFGLGEVAEVQ